MYLVSFPIFYNPRIFSGFNTHSFLSIAIIHIIIHNFQRPHSIVIPPNTPSLFSSRHEHPDDDNNNEYSGMMGHNIHPSESRNDELLQRKERTLQRRRLGRRIIWDIAVWVLLVPVGGGGVVWAVGRVLRKW